MRGEWLEAGSHVMDVGGGLGPDVYARVDLSLRLGTAPAPVGHPEWQARGNITYAAHGTSPTAGEGSSSGQDRMPRERVVMMEELLTGRPGRISREQITHSTRGNAQGAQFFAVAGAVYEAAQTQALGRQLPTEWFLQDIRD
jgi:hypothetical protein